MRASPGILCLALALAGCVGPLARIDPRPDAPAAVLPTGGYDGPVEPLTTPLDLAYGDADFRTKVTIAVSGPADGQRRVNTLEAHVSGRLERAGNRIIGQVVTERIEIDGAPSARQTALLVQDLVLSHKGRLVEIATRSPVQAAPDQPLPDRLRALEQRWRERLPTFGPTPVAAGDSIYEDANLLAPLRQMLQDRPYEMKVVQPVRAVAVGLAPCAGRSCLLARLEGEAMLMAPPNAVRVTTDGYELIDIATGLIVDGHGVVELTRGDDGQMLTMTVDTETVL